VHLETLYPERQAARECARREKAPRRQNLRWTLKPWQTRIELTPGDILGSRVASARDSLKMVGRVPPRPEGR